MTYITSRTAPPLVETHPDAVKRAVNERTTRQRRGIPAEGARVPRFLYTVFPGASYLEPAYFIHRLHFAFLVTFHYLFPQLTMGLAPLIVVLKTVALRTKNELYDHAARFWMKIFGINFVLGVVTASRWSFSSERTGLASRTGPEASSARVS